MTQIKKIVGHAGLKFWLMRVSEEHFKKASAEIQRSQDLMFQRHYYNDMQERGKTEVEKNLIEDMIALGWHKEVDELTKEEE